MDAPLTLHTHQMTPLYGGLAGAPAWHPRFEAYIGRLVPTAIARQRRRQRYWWQDPGVVDALHAEFPDATITAIVALKSGATEDELATAYNVSVGWLRKQARDIATCVYRLTQAF